MDRKKELGLHTCNSNAERRNHNKRALIGTPKIMCMLSNGKRINCRIKIFTQSPIVTQRRQGSRKHSGRKCMTYC